MPGLLQQTPPHVGSATTANKPSKCYILHGKCLLYQTPCALLSVQHIEQSDLIQQRGCGYCFVILLLHPLQLELRLPAGVGCCCLMWLGCAQDYPEQRLQFFALLRAITNACFSTLFAMSPGQLKLVIDSIIWAFRHTERNVADTGGALTPAQLCIILRHM